MWKNIKGTCYQIKKFILRHDRFAELLVSLLLSIITYFIGNKIENKTNIDSTIYDFLLILITLFVFFITEVTLYVIFHEDAIAKRILKIRVDTENAMDPTMTAFLQFLAEECYGRCSKQGKDCLDCDLYKTNKCNGLLRNYIYEDCLRLADSIQKADKGEYFLNTNIEEYHVFAIKHFMELQCQKYCVIQKIAQRDEELYDSQDFHFLFSLIENVTKVQKRQASSYVKKNKFEVNWLFVGDPKHIKNNYDYIFFVFSKFDKSLKIKKFFKFRYIDENDFLAKIQGQAKITNYISIDNPSIGIFGDEFVFVDSPNANLEHGNIYTSNYKNVKDVFSFFEELWALSKDLSFDSLEQEYKNILNDKYEQILQNRWTKH